MGIKSSKTRVKPDWEQLEIVIADIQRQLAPTATVVHNDSILGRSGRTRKLDVTVRNSIGGHPILIVFDSKRHSRTVKLKDVAAFAEQIEDVNANLGVMISNSGFDAGAVAYLRHCVRDRHA